MNDVEHVLIWLSGVVCLFAVFVMRYLMRRVDMLESRMDRLIRSHNALHGHLRVD